MIVVWANEVEKVGHRSRHCRFPCRHFCSEKLEMSWQWRVYRIEQYIRSLACVRQTMSVPYPRAQLAAIANKVKVISLSRPARFLVLSLRTALSLQLELNEIRLRVLASRCLNIDSLLLL